MGVVLGTIGTLMFIIGIISIIVSIFLKNKKMWFTISGSITFVGIIFFIIGMANTDIEKLKEQEATKTEAPKEQKDNIAWEEKINEVASSDMNETEKFTEISLYANDYEATKEEISNFEKYIIKEYKTGNYINDITNHKYMLENIFKSQVVDQFYDDDVPIKLFAFDFWQNSKYLYRGVDDKDSQATLSNEKQMDDALKEME